MVLSPVVNIKGEAMIAFLEKHFGKEHDYTTNFIDEWVTARDSDAEMVYDVFVEYDENGIRITLPAFALQQKQKD